jgi:hypothetical protein
MSTTENNQPEASAPTGAFGKDKQFGNRLDAMFAMGEPFLLLGWKLDSVISTVHGEAQTVKLLVQKLNHDTGLPMGPPFTCNTVASAIVEKVQALTKEELEAGPVCNWQIVTSKGRGTNAMVLQWLRNLSDQEDYSEFGLDASAVGKVADLARPASERIGF